MRLAYLHPTEWSQPLKLSIPLVTVGKQYLDGLLYELGGNIMWWIFSFPFYALPLSEINLVQHVVCCAVHNIDDNLVPRPLLEDKCCGLSGSLTAWEYSLACTTSNQTSTSFPSPYKSNSHGHSWTLNTVQSENHYRHQTTWEQNQNLFCFESP